MSNKNKSSRSPSLAEVQAELSNIKRHLEQRDQARRNDLRIAERVHRSMLPLPVEHSHIHVDVRYIPIDEVGGDYCQVLFPTDSTCYITICDVTGHGFGPAMLATRVSSEVRRLVSLLSPPADIVQKLNEFIFHNFNETDLQLTFFAARFDFKQMSLTFSGAGHPGALLISPDSQVVQSLDSQNMLIGVAEHCLSDQPSDTRQLFPGDRLLFFTDGATEAMDAQGNLLGVQEFTRMATATCTGKFFDQADRLLEKIATFRAGMPQDDITLILAQMQ
jgi:serine phosphatase RsbU (regulator of sigma subunit)